jgi:hypothetical protein
MWKVWKDKKNGETKTIRLTSVVVCQKVNILSQTGSQKNNPISKCGRLKAKLLPKSH